MNIVLTDFRQKQDKLHHNNKRNISMANFRLTYAARNAVIYSTTLAFTLASVSPVYGFQPKQCAVNINDINMAIKFEKLIEKAHVIS